MIVVSYQAIGFDLDDTLYDRCEIYRKIFTVMQAAVTHLEVDFETFYPIYLDYSDAEYELFIRHGKEKEAYRNDRVIATYKYFGKNINQDAAITFNALYLYFRDELELRPGVKMLLNYLKQQEIKMFILTNGPSVEQRNKLHQLKLEEWIPASCWYISDELGYSKPDVDIFKLVERDLDVENILYIGDDYYNDIIGAQSVGWKSFHLAKQVTKYSLATQTVGNFDEILSVLNRV